MPTAPDGMDARFAGLEIDGVAPPLPPPPAAPPTAQAEALAPIAAVARDLAPPVQQEIPAAAAPAAVRPAPGGQLIALSLPDEVTGAVAYWQLHGETSLARLREEWAAQLLPADMLPQPCSKETALRRAVQNCTTRTRLVRKHPAGGWAVVEEIARAGAPLEYQQIARYWLASGVLACDAAPAHYEEAQQLGSRISYEIARFVLLLSASDMSAWLVDLMARRLRGVPLRERGGIYFVPREGIATLRAVKAALAGAAAHVVHEIPAMHSAEAIAAVLDAIQREVRSEAEEIQGELVREEIGPKAQQARMRRVAEISDKVAAYEQLLGQPLGGLKEQLQGLRTGLAKAATRGSLLEIT